MTVIVIVIVIVCVLAVSFSSISRLHVCLCVILLHSIGVEGLVQMLARHDQIAAVAHDYVQRVGANVVGRILAGGVSVHRFV